MTMTDTKTKSKAQVERDEAEAAKNELRELFSTDRTVYTRLLSVSRSGMHRVIALYVARDNQIINITMSVAKVIGSKVKKVHGYVGIPVNGCGMDMGYDLVHRLSYYLYESGSDKKAGYRLTHRWM